MLRFTNGPSFILFFLKAENCHIDLYILTVGPWARGGLKNT